MTNSVALKRHKIFFFKSDVPPGHGVPSKVESRGRVIQFATKPVLVNGKSEYLVSKYLQSLYVIYKFICYLFRWMSYLDVLPHLLQHVLVTQMAKPLIVTIFEMFAICDMTSAMTS